MFGLHLGSPESSSFPASASSSVSSSEKPRRCHLLRLELELSLGERSAKPPVHSKAPPSHPQQATEGKRARDDSNHLRAPAEPMNPTLFIWSWYYFRHDVSKVLQHSSLISRAVQRLDLQYPETWTLEKWLDEVRLAISDIQPLPSWLECSINLVVHQPPRTCSSGGCQPTS